MATGRVRRLRERHVRLDPVGVGLVHLGGFSHVTLTFGALRGEEMPARGVLTADLARPRDLESLGDGFSRFAARNRLRHKARKIEAVLPPDNRFSTRRPLGTGGGFQKRFASDLQPRKLA